MMMRPLKKRTANKPEANATTVYVVAGTAESDDKMDSNMRITETNGNMGGEAENPHDLRSDDGLLKGEDEVATGDRDASHKGAGLDGVSAENIGRKYKTYKRRWFGLFQLVLLNIVVSWDWLTFSANSTTTSQFYGVSISAINWLSTSFLFSFVAISPVVLWILHKSGPTYSIMISSALLLCGNWIRYGATRAGGHYGALMFGQIIIGFAQPFVLAAPTRYSDLWFTSRGRVAATAAMSLANPLGGALAQLINPFWAGDGQSDRVPSMVLYIAIIATVASIPSLFIPHAPPTPVAASSEEAKYALRPSFKLLARSPEFYLVAIPFMIYVGLFNSLSTLINNMLAPYGFSETEAGIAGALLIVVGLVTCAITSPIIDRNKMHLLAVKICVPLIALSYLAFTFAPSTRSIPAIYVILSILGASSFTLMPVALEYMIELTHPVSPETSSTFCWTGGQLTGTIFILVSEALKAPGLSDGSTDDGTTRPPGNLYNALTFQAVFAMVVLPLPMVLGLFGRHKEVRLRRVDADYQATVRRDSESAGVTQIP
ncbi:major facilitator superfamily domain-containing protein [Calycina marina]|uniref:Major facilitator superfamily domain-containing protein n=1 Tax=Calycina marina TaxID=1763456 RepID=A0A9P8CBQ9_9HELO|nr:major facilitator superfamily domain-containing protein [Calycina marina]